MRGGSAVGCDVRAIQYTSTACGCIFQTGHVVCAVRHLRLAQAWQQGLQAARQPSNDSAGSKTGTDSDVMMCTAMYAGSCIHAWAFMCRHCYHTMQAQALNHTLLLHHSHISP